MTGESQGKETLSFQTGTLMALADIWELWIQRETHLVVHDPLIAHVGTQDPALAAPDINGHVLAPAAPSAQPTLGKGMNGTKVEINTDTSVRDPGQVLHQVRRTLIRREGVGRRKKSTVVVRRRGKGREKRKTRK